MSTIHGLSHRGLRYLREKPASLAVFWVYASRTNNEGIAWPGLKKLVKDTGWSMPTCIEARRWLVAHEALEEVPGYVRPKWRKLDNSERQHLIESDQSAYYRPTGYFIADDGIKYPLLYFPGQTPAEIDGEEGISAQSAEGDTQPGLVGDTQLGLVGGTQPGLVGDTQPGLAELSTNTELSTITNIAPGEAGDAEPDESDPPAMGGKPRDPIWDNVATLVFQLPPNGATERGRTGQIVSWLKGNLTKAMKDKGVPQLQTPADPGEIPAFIDYYHLKFNNDTALPKDIGKFAEHFLAYRAARDKVLQAREVYVPEPLPEWSEEERAQRSRVVKGALASVKDKRPVLTG